MLSDFYSHNKTYEKISRGRRDGIASLLTIFPHALVLDIGCGPGILGLYIKTLHPEAVVDGVDISEPDVREAQKYLDTAVVCDIEHEPFSWPETIRSKHYHRVIISEVLEHLFFPERLLQHIQEVTLPDAEIIITVPNVLFWKNRLRLLLGHFEYTDRGLMDRGHIHFFSWKSLRTIIYACKYRITGTAHHVPTRGTRFLAKLFPGLFAYQFIVRITRVEYE